MTSEKRFIENILSDLFSYECDRVKNGRTIRIQVFDKKEGSTSIQKKDFRKEEEARKFLKEIRKPKNKRGKKE